ncbi:caspase family protein [Runella sp. MFBS21]|uniref:caspase family protein n=1 Tax=Runella sp. MFBS21 TaxID=3034018 RepID=UPI0038F5F0FE
MRTFFYYSLFFLFSLGLLSTPAFAQPKGMKPVGGNAPAGTERRLALVVGNKDYPYLNPLRNPLNDANDMEAALKRLGFEVITVTNADYRALTNALTRFKEGLTQSDVAFFYYSGHGASYGGKNYLLPTDLNADCLEQIEDQGLSLNRILGDIASKGVKNSFVVLDACRNIPKLRLCDNSKKDITTNGYVKPTNNPRGSMVIYATEEGTTADDNATGRNGLFTGALLKYLTRPNLTIKNILDQASLEVDDKSGGRQTPARYDKIYGDFYFVLSGDTPSKPLPAATEVKTPPLEPNMQVIRIKSIKEAIKFDLKEFTVIAGKPVELIFDNPDAMHHNLVIVKPKAMDIVGNAADKMITQKDAAEKNYVPNLPHVIAYTPLVNPNQSFRLTFMAPTEPGNYPYICTFPGHWRLMNGVMKVVKEESKPK